MQPFLFAFLVFLFSLSSAFAYPFSKPILIQQVTKEGLLLNKGWKFHAGDDMAWAKPNIDDGSWEAINPVTDIHYLPEVKKAGICWFRLKLQVDSSLLDKPLALVINQIGASEIYLNGKLLQQFGRVSKDPASLMTFNPKGKPIVIHFTGSVQQVLAVRYAIAPKTPYLNYIGFGNPCFSIRLQQASEAFDNYTTPIIIILTNLLHYGVFLILSVIHLFFYIYYPSRKENLYFAIYTFTFSLALLGDPAFALINDAFWLFVMQIAFILSVAVSEIFLVLSIYKLFGQKKDIYFKCTCMLCLLSVASTFWFYAWGWIVIYFNLILGALVTIRVSVVGIQSKQRGATVVLGAQIIFLLLFFLFTLHVVNNVPLQENLLFLTTTGYQVTATIALLCPPLFISILLATEFGQMNRSLKQQLIEVEKLSKKTIAQEQEKQHILATQNENLEQQVTERTTVIVAQKEEIETQRDNLEKTLGCV
jgi:two-component system, NtrC family, sensor kinase